MRFRLGFRTIEKPYGIQKLAPVCGNMHRRQVKHKTELAYIGRAPFKNVAHVVQHLRSSICFDARSSHVPLLNFLGPPVSPDAHIHLLRHRLPQGRTKPKVAASPHLCLLPESPPPPVHINPESSPLPPPLSPPPVNILFAPPPGFLGHDSAAHTPQLRRDAAPSQSPLRLSCGISRSACRINPDRAT